MNRITIYAAFWFLLNATAADAQEPLELPNYVPPGLELEDEGTTADASAEATKVASREKEERSAPWMMQWNVTVDFNLDELPFFQKSGADEDAW